jgi:hypothetical protein
VELELDPEQPPAIARAVAALLLRAGAADEVDPWWRAGLDDARDAEDCG